MFKEIVCPAPVCSCFRLPPYGKFTIGAYYSFEYIIDGEKMMDDSGEMITFPEKIFKSCFDNLGKAVTCYSPVFMDGTTYHIYLIIQNLPPNLEEIKAYAKIMNINYVQAKKALTDKRNLILSGNAYDIEEVLEKLSHFHVNYEIDPTYPHGMDLRGSRKD